MSTDLLDKRETRIRTMFGNIAPRYDLLNHLLSLNIDRWWRWRTTRLVPPIIDGTPAPILDVCTGTGDLALAYDRAARHRVPIVGTRFLPADAAAGPREDAGSVAPRNGSPISKPTRSNCPSPTNTFQLVTVAFGLRNVTDTDRGIAEMVRVSRPGGRVAILEFSRPRNWLLGPLYRAYFRWVLPLVGQLISRSRDQAYNYLPASVMEFPDGEALAEKLRGHGLVEVRYHPLTFGVATLYVGTKPANDSAIRFGAARG